MPKNSILLFPQGYTLQVSNIVLHCTQLVRASRHMLSPVYMLELRKCCANASEPLLWENSVHGKGSDVDTAHAMLRNRW